MPIFVKVDASMPWHDKIADRLTSDSARWAYVKMLCHAKQRENPVYSSRRTLADALGRHAKYIEMMVKAGLLDRDSGRYIVHDFDERQAPNDPTAAERQRRFRAQKARNTQVSNTVETPLSAVTRNAVTSRRDGNAPEQNRDYVDTDTKLVPTARAREGASAEPPDDDDDVDAIVEHLLAAGVWKRPTKAMIGFLANLVRDHGDGAVRGAIAQEPNGPQFMSNVAARLRSQAEAAAERRERARIEAERLQYEREQDSIEQMRRSDPDAEKKAAERRRAISDFASGFSTEGST